MNYPLISCIMPTFGRYPQDIHLVEEAIASFISQTYPHKELVILNECPNQTLEISPNYQDKGVKIYNLSQEKYSSLGAKYNRLLELAKGEYIAPWEDDDISLPHRLELSLFCIQNKDYFNPKSYWFYNTYNQQMKVEIGTVLGHQASLYRKSAMLSLGGYPDNCKQDVEAHRKLQTIPHLLGNLSPFTCYYIYRWGVSSSGHLSAVDDPEIKWKEVQAKTYPSASVNLEPKLKRNYLALRRKILNTGDVSI